MNKKKCFVITPIGKEGSDLRKYMDAMIEHVVKKVMKNYTVIAAHQICVTGNITEQIMNEIAESDAIFANLTGCNPNVMYELALSHCTGKPVIMMAEEGTEIPFDISPMRVFKYTYDVIGIEKLKETLIHVVKNIETKGKLYEFQSALEMLEKTYGISIEKVKAVVDPLFLKIGSHHEPPMLLTTKGELEENLSLSERTEGATKIRLVNYAGTSFLANEVISTSYDPEWRTWFEDALDGGVLFNLVLTKPGTSAAEDAAKYKMYPEQGTDINKNNLILKNYEAIQALIAKQPHIKLLAKFTDVALPYGLFETIFPDKTKNHIKVDLYSPLTGNDSERPSFMVYKSKNPKLYNHFSTVITKLMEHKSAETVMNTLAP